MNAIYFLMVIAILLATGFVLSFIWAAKRGQFEDLDTPSMRILLEDKEIVTTNQQNEVL